MYNKVSTDLVYISSKWEGQVDINDNTNHNYAIILLLLYIFRVYLPVVYQFSYKLI